MKSQIIILFLLIFGCKSQSQELEIFKKELGPTKTKALNSLIESFEQYLSKNYPNEQTYTRRTKKFLSDILNNQPLGKLDESNAKKVLCLMEESGLRKDIYIYDSEVESYINKYQIEQFLPKREQHPIDLGEVEENFEDILELDSLELTKEEKSAIEKREKQFHKYLKQRPIFNSKGLFLYALAKAMKSNMAFMQYLEIKNMGLDVSPSLLADGYLKNMSDQELEIWYNKIPLVIDIYYFELLHRYPLL